jgi:hypothetical protein
VVRVEESQQWGSQEWEREKVKGGKQERVRGAITPEASLPSGITVAFAFMHAQIISDHLFLGERTPFLCISHPPPLRRSTILSPPSTTSHSSRSTILPPLMHLASRHGLADDSHWTLP